MKDPRMNPLLEFFSSQGVKFVDAETGELMIDENVTLCEGCWGMTKTNLKDNTCMKCGAKKREENESKK